jgi:ribonuclease HI
MQTLDQKLVIFTDGSALGNPGPGGYGAILGFEVLDEVIELGGGKPHTTNNEMELTAVIAALAYAANNIAPTTIYTDSSYVVKGITQWVNGWEKNGWMTKDKKPVSHQALWQQLVELVRAREIEAPITWEVVPGHVGIPGNERADGIATGFAKAEPVELYRGRMSAYDVDLTNLEIDETLLQKKKTSKSGTPAGKAYCYLSLVDDVLMKHETWAECKARVDGKKAKYRKAISPEHEQEILDDWGVSF